MFGWFIKNTIFIQEKHSIFFNLKLPPFFIRNLIDYFKNVTIFIKEMQFTFLNLNFPRVTRMEFIDWLTSHPHSSYTAPRRFFFQISPTFTHLPSKLNLIKKFSNFYLKILSKVTIFAVLSQ